MMMMEMVVEVNHDKSTSNDSSSCEGVEEDGGVDRKQAGGVVGKENSAQIKTLLYSVKKRHS